MPMHIHLQTIYLSTASVQESFCYSGQRFLQQEQERPLEKLWDSNLQERGGGGTENSPARKKTLHSMPTFTMHGLRHWVYLYWQYNLANLCTTFKKKLHLGFLLPH